MTGLQLGGIIAGISGATVISIGENIRDLICGKPKEEEKVELTKVQPQKDEDPAGPGEDDVEKDKK